MEKTKSFLLEFHHIGMACKSFEREEKALKLLGYKQEGHDFTDDLQGVFGRFLTAENQPRIELLKNTPTSHTLDLWLKKRAKIYHIAYVVDNPENAINFLTSWGGGKWQENLWFQAISKRKSVLYFYQICS